MIDGRNFFERPVKNYLRTYDNIQKIAIGPGDDYTTDRVPDYPYIKKYYQLIAINLSKWQKLDAIQKWYNTLILLEI